MASLHQPRSRPTCSVHKKVPQRQILTINDLNKRATLITGASSIIVGIVAAAKFLPERSASFSVESALLGVVCGCSVVMYWYAVQVWRASLKAMPGTTDVDDVRPVYRRE